MIENILNLTKLAFADIVIDYFDALGVWATNLRQWVTAIQTGLDDFRLMFWMTVLSIPCLLLMREKKVVSQKRVEEASETVALAAE